MKIPASLVDGSHDATTPAKSTELHGTSTKIEAETMHFTTKLSLPKFFQVANSLTHMQRKLVEDIGFHHLLDLSCTILPKPIIFWLAKHFNVLSKTFSLPNGYSFMLTPTHMHHVLGIPIGGASIPNVCTENTKKLIHEETKCSGNHPTINELKDLITPDLLGDQFKRIFALFALTSFLCPTSSEYSSAEFYQAIKDPNIIASYDWSSAVLEKLVSAISKFQQSSNVCSTPALGGCTFAMMIVYFELLDTSELNLPYFAPRISLWSNENVSTFIELDKINEEGTNFGRTPVKVSNITPLGTQKLNQGIFIDTSNEIGEKLLSIIPGHQFCKDREELQLSYHELWMDFIAATRPVFMSQILKVASLSRQCKQITLGNLSNTHCSSKLHTPATSDAPSCVNQAQLISPSPNPNPSKDLADTDTKKGIELGNPFGDMLPPQIMDIQQNPKELFDHYCQNLQYIELWEGFDICPTGDNFMDELCKLFTSTVAVETPEDENHQTLSDFTLSLVMSGSPDDMKMSCKSAERKEDYIYAEAPVQAAVPFDSTSPLCPLSMVPVRKRPFPRSLSDPSKSPSSIQTTSDSTTKRGMSLNEFAMQRISTIVAARKKRLKFESSQRDQPVLSDELTNPTTTATTAPVQQYENQLSETQKADAILSPSHQQQLETVNPVSIQQNEKQLCETQQAGDIPSSSHQQQLETKPNIDSTTANAHVSSKNLHPQLLSDHVDNSRNDTNSQGTTAVAHNQLNDDIWDWDEETLRQFDESVALATSSQNIPSTNTIPLTPVIYFHSFASTPVQRAVHQYIVDNIPAPAPCRSPRIIKMVKSNWVDHRTFGLSMQVYGSISHNVMNIMGVAVMEEQYTKHLQGLLHHEQWGKFILHYDLASPLQDPNFVPTSISASLSEKQLGFRLENADLVFVPVRKKNFWYVVVANFRDKRFEVLCPFKEITITEDEAFVVVTNFIKLFKAVHSRSRRVDIHSMPMVTGNLANYNNQNDSGVFVMQLLLSYNGNTHFQFKQEDAKPLRESLTYYLCTHQENQIVLPEIKQICEQHCVKLVNYT